MNNNHKEKLNGYDIFFHKKLSCWVAKKINIECKGDYKTVRDHVNYRQKG